MGNENVTLPAYLYKYRSFEAPDHLKEIIHDNKLWFSDPTNQNDPFEFSPIVNTGKSLGEKQKLAKWIQSVFRERGADRSERTRLRKNTVQRCRKNPQELRDVYASHLKKYGMYCFTENPKSIIMWAYYGSGHTGYCLKFDTRNDFFESAKPINYSLRYPIVKPYINDADEWGKESVLTKAIYWEHECEWRLFSKKHGHVDFPADCLIEIIFGCKMDPKDQKRIKNWCNEHDPPILLTKAVPHDSEYKLDIKTYLDG